MLTVVYRIASDEEVARDYAQKAWLVDLSLDRAGEVLSLTI